MSPNSGTRRTVRSTSGFEIANRLQVTVRQLLSRIFLRQERRSEEAIYGATTYRQASTSHRFWSIFSILLWLLGSIVVGTTLKMQWDSVSREQSRGVREHNRVAEELKILNRQQPASDPHRISERQIDMRRMAGELEKRDITLRRQREDLERERRTRKRMEEELHDQNRSLEHQKDDLIQQRRQLRLDNSDL